MGVVMGVVFIDGSSSKLLVLVSEVGAVVDEASILCLLDDGFSVCGEAGGGVGAGSSHAGVIWGWRSDDDVGSLGVQQRGGVADVGRVGLDDFSGDGFAGFVAGSVAVGSLVVGCGDASSVVVAKFDNDDVAGLDGVDDMTKSVLVGVGAG